jgi:hypothetical protein
MMAASMRPLRGEVRKEPVDGASSSFSLPSGRRIIFSNSGSVMLFE